MPLVVVRASRSPTAAACGTPGFLRCILATPRPVLEELVDRMATALA